MSHAPWARYDSRTRRGRSLKLRRHSTPPWALYGTPRKGGRYVSPAPPNETRNPFAVGTSEQSDTFNGTAQVRPVAPVQDAHMVSRYLTTRSYCTQPNKMVELGSVAHIPRVHHHLCTASKSCGLRRTRDEVAARRRFPPAPTRKSCCSIPKWRASRAVSSKARSFLLVVRRRASCVVVVVRRSRSQGRSLHGVGSAWIFSPCHARPTTRAVRRFPHVLDL
jgi:hypothetical protein